MLSFSMLSKLCNVIRYIMNSLFSLSHYSPSCCVCNKSARYRQKCFVKTEGDLTVQVIRDTQAVEK
jgi:hypothetical protein